MYETLNGLGRTCGSCHLSILVARNLQRKWILRDRNFKEDRNFYVWEEFLRDSLGCLFFPQP